MDTVQLDLVILAGTSRTAERRASETRAAEEGPLKKGGKGVPGGEQIERGY
jgi:hypothetical protein